MLRKILNWLFGKKEEIRFINTGDVIRLKLDEKELDKIISFHIKNYASNKVLKYKSVSKFISNNEPNNVQIEFKDIDLEKVELNLSNELVQFAKIYNGLKFKLNDEKFNQFMLNIV